MKKMITLLLISALLLTLSACARPTPAETQAPPAQAQTEPAGTAAGTRIVTDGAGRDVEIPARVERIVCVNVGALRYSCYMGAQDLVVGVEDYEQKATMSRLYNYVNFDYFASLPVIGTNGEHFPEAIIGAAPDVIIMAAFDDHDADDLTAKPASPLWWFPAAIP